jgi:hypothetical protein
MLTIISTFGGGLTSSTKEENDYGFRTICPSRFFLKKIPHLFDFSVFSRVDFRTSYHRQAGGLLRPADFVLLKKEVERRRVFQCLKKLKLKLKN